ncbi:MAG: putative oxygen-independent coproporphyrinogen III oxidase [Gammaproteobacteria bacterium]|jgi:putative oxygen-independent coproporphyrinogen III oxidase
MQLSVNIPLGLYIHLPWCIRKCPYCDFNSHEQSGELPFNRYVDAVLLDLDNEVAGLGASRELVSIFIGGGTPSLFPCDAIQELLDGVKRITNCSEHIEVTLEANPGAADAVRFEGYLSAGVNRISIGVQSFRDHQLRRLGRVHDAATACDAIRAARAAGCKNINIDIMHGLPDDEKEDSLFDLRRAIDFEPEHLSWYQLTLEPGTVFARKPPTLPSHDDIADQFDRGRGLLQENGYDQYEISAYSRAELRATHNVNYWEFGDYIGVGAGAHGKLTTAEGIFRTEKRRGPTPYMRHAGTAEETSNSGPLDSSQLTAEFAMNVLRLRHGYRESLFSERTGLDLLVMNPAVDEALERGWLTRRNGVVRPTELGYRFLNDLQLLFVA